jgi:hypothetical protein
MDKYSLLNKRMQDLADLIGIDLTLILSEHFGGTHLNIPNKAKPNHALVSLIGLDAFKKLCAAYGSTKLEINLCNSFIKHCRNIEILEGAKQGATNAQLSKKFNMTERGIRGIKAKALKAGAE